MILALRERVGDFFAVRFVFRETRYEDRLVHEHVILDGPAGYLKTPLDHDQGMACYYQRHNHYTTLEAIEIVRAKRGIGQPLLAGKLFDRGPQGRRAATAWRR